MKNEGLLISIITPYFDTLEYTKELAKVLAPQLNKQVEWIIVDDGCHEKELDDLPADVIHLEENSGGASIPRNVGLDVAMGKYICFIDSDDLVSSDYISTIIEKTEEDWEYCYFGWKGDHEVIIIDEPPKWNCSHPPPIP